MDKKVLKCEKKAVTVGVNCVCDRNRNESDSPALLLLLLGCVSKDSPPPALSLF